jgi:isoleucyl-tRNA synthetase
VRQSKAFQRFGVFGDFEKPYLTLQPEFEAAQIRAFGEMFKKGFIFRGRKPVHWSPSSRTALAEVELEYPEGHISKSIYVAFPIDAPSDALIPNHSKEEPLRVSIWVVHHKKTGKLLVAADLAETLAKKFDLPDGEKLEVIATMKDMISLGLPSRIPCMNAHLPC